MRYNPVLRFIYDHSLIIFHTCTGMPGWHYSEISATILHSRIVLDICEIGPRGKNLPLELNVDTLGAIQKVCHRPRGEGGEAK